MITKSKSCILGQKVRSLTSGSYHLPFSMKEEKGFIIFPTEGRLLIAYYWHGIKVAVGQTLFDLRQSI